MGSPVTDVPKSTPGHGGARANAGAKPGRPKGSGTKNAQNDAYTVLAKAKAKHETYKAQIAELEYKQRSGELIEASRVADIWRRHVETAKGRLLAVPGAIGAQLLRAESTADAEKIMRDALYAVMEEIANAGIDES
jgi:hypothetical protein